MIKNKKVKVIKFKGGLGNQLFQYAFLRYIELICQETPVKADLFYYNSFHNSTVRKPRILKFKVKLDTASKFEVNEICIFKRYGNPLKLLYKGILFFEIKLNRKYFFESSRVFMHYDQLAKHSYYDGYWQSYSYIEAIEPYLRKEIVPNFKLSLNTQALVNNMSEENSVFIGIRRGDYLTSAKNKKRYGTFDQPYYTRAINYIKERVKNPVFYVFSNDIAWVKDNMQFEGNVVYRNPEDQTSDVEELVLMGSCKHAIIVNSTFHWWGAWLIENKDKVIIAPKQWYADGTENDIVPESWVRI